MKKYIILFACLIITLTTMAQKMPSVAGVTFGDSYSQCKSVLVNRFGADYESDAESIVFYNVTIGNIHFDSAFFQFQCEGTNSYLSGVMLTINCKHRPKAVEERDKLLKVYETKYEYQDFYWNDSKFRVYLLGTNPKNKDTHLVSIGASQDSDGECRTFVIYGPISFIDPTDDL